MQMIKEEFRDIPGYEGIYQASNLGRIKSFKSGKEKILKGNINTKGYYGTSLSINNKYYTKEIHKLIAMAFLDHIPDGTNKIVVDHVNNNRLDNRLENLQLITQRHNTSKDKKNGTSKYTGVTFESNKWRARIRVNEKKLHLGLFNTEIEAHNAYQNKLSEINSKLNII